MMIPPKDLHVTMTYKNNSIQFDLNKTKSDLPIQIGSTTYYVHANQEHLNTIQGIFDSFHSKVNSKTDLSSKLGTMEGMSAVNITKTRKVSEPLLTGKPSISIWKQDDDSKIGKWREYVATQYWSKRNTASDTDLIGFIKDTKSIIQAEEIKKALDSNDKHAFNLFIDTLSSIDLFPILSMVNIDAINLGAVKKEPYLITQNDLVKVEEYMAASNFSGIVCLSDASGKTYTISATFPKDHYAAIHSIGKVFTGALVISMIRQGDLDPDVLSRPLQLDDIVMEQLPKTVQDQLKSGVTMHEIMLHKGKLGDYLPKYFNAIQASLSSEQTPFPPVPITDPKGFLQYADEAITENDYSNLGLLLVGLSLEHHAQEPYNDLLKRHVLDPAQIREFAINKPDDKFVENPSNYVAKYLSGSPAGGYWMTVEELNKFGSWMKDNCKDEGFLSLIKEYGGEMHHDGEIRHGGRVRGSSAYLSTFIGNGVTIAILSAQDNCAAHRLYGGIKEHLLSE